MGKSENQDPKIHDDLDPPIPDGEEMSEKSENENTQDITINASKIVLVKKLLENIKENTERINQLIFANVDEEQISRISIGQMSDLITPAESSTEEAGGRIIEGVFDGENMIGPDGKQYSVPANYASKSKLVEGDILKLTITQSGTFVYKQIGPIERRRIVGMLEQSASGNFTVDSDNKKWRVLTASVTYFKGQAGDEVVILIPKTGESKWAAVENIVKNPE